MDKNERLAAELEYEMEVLQRFYKRVEDINIKIVSVWRDLCDKEDNIYADGFNKPSETVEKMSKILFGVRTFREELLTRRYNIKSLFGHYESEEFFNKIKNTSKSCLKCDEYFGYINKMSCEDCEEE